MIATAPELDEMEKLDRELAQRSLKEFVRTFWHVVEPGKAFVEGPHIDAICIHLEHVTRSVLYPDQVKVPIRQLLINIPPRCMKSLLVSVFWPAWVWTFRPEARFMFESYAHSLSTRDSIKCRRVMESDLYQRFWGHIWQFSEVQNAKHRFENSRSGFRMATSEDGPSTGEGADFLVCDDPHSVLDALSDGVLEKTVFWFDEVWGSRLNDPATGGMIVIMQRVSEKDVSGHIIKKIKAAEAESETGNIDEDGNVQVNGGDWVHLCLPMEYDQARHCRTPIWEDWRTEDGQLLWPQRIGPSALQKLKKRLGRYGVAGQLQQSPTPRGGGMFERHWFEVVKVAPAKGQIIRYWDKAGTEDDGDWTVGLKMLKDEHGQFYVLGVVRIQGSPLKVEQTILNTAKQDGVNCRIRINQDPGQAGKSDVANFVRLLQGYIVKGVLEQKNKETRALAVAAQAEAGNVKLVDGPWVEPFLDEICAFPRGEHDDQVDTFAGAFNELVVGRVLLLS